MPSSHPDPGPRKTRRTPHPFLFGDFWSAENGLTALLIFTVVYVFVVAAAGDYSLGGLAGRIMFSLIIAAGVMATFKRKWLSFLVVALAVLGLACDWIDVIHPEMGLVLVNAILGMVFLVILLAVLIIQVFRRGAVTPHKIRGAIVVYLLIGGMWSFFYFIAALTLPQAFRWPEGQVPANMGALQQGLTYFSYITLTTTGFGDITPAVPLTRALAMLEALAGQLYLVITLARLVSLAVAGHNPTPGPEE
jgi:hypothetical protein